ncbi:MAG: hypothetical protein V3U60_12355, partial [Gammaproteobacteria bacterium]
YLGPQKPLYAPLLFYARSTQPSTGRQRGVSPKGRVRDSRVRRQHMEVLSVHPEQPEARREVPKGPSRRGAFSFGSF